MYPVSATISQYTSSELLLRLLLLALGFFFFFPLGIYTVFQQPPSFVFLLFAVILDFQLSGHHCCFWLLFLTPVLLLSLKDIIYQSSQQFHFLVPPHLVLSLLSHSNPSLGYPSAVCYFWLCYLCSFPSDHRSFNFPCWPLSELLHPAVTPHFISPRYPWQSSISCFLSSFQLRSSSDCSFNYSSFLLAVSYICLYCSTPHTICCAAACMTHPENNTNPSASPRSKLGSQQRHSCIQSRHQQQSSQDPRGIQVRNFCLNQ